MKVYKDRLREQKGETCAKPAKLALVMKQVFSWKSHNSSQKESKMGGRVVLWFTALSARPPPAGAVPSRDIVTVRVRASARSTKASKKRGREREGGRVRRERGRQTVGEKYRERAKRRKGETEKEGETENLRGSSKPAAF